MIENSNWQTKLIVAVITVMTPIAPVIFTVVGLVIADFVTGVYASVKVNERITSRRMSETVSKLILMSIGIISAYFAETYIIPEVPLVKVLAGFVALVELQSIFENAFKATGKDVFKNLKEIISRKREDNSTIPNTDRES